LLAAFDYSTEFHALGLWHNLWVILRQFRVFASFLPEEFRTPAAGAGRVAWDLSGKMAHQQRGMMSLPLWPVA
jgi:hypothetical protein